VYLHRLRIKDVRGFHGIHEVDLDFELTMTGNRYPGFVVVAGRNGSGKTTLLRAAAAVLAGPVVSSNLTEGVREWVTHGASIAVVNGDVEPAGDELEPEARRFDAGLLWQRVEGAHARPQIDWSETFGGREFNIPQAERSPWAPNPKRWFSAGYGPFRRLAGTSGEVARLVAGDWTVARFATLFREEASLAETVPWLQQVNYRARSGQGRYAGLERQFFALLNDGLFPDGYTAHRVDPDGLWIGRPGEKPIQIEACFNGSIPWAEDDSPRIMCSGVVLIDEIDAHLHVTWQKQIGPWLRAHFPNIQFIVTTHSPYICQSASPGGLIQLPGPNDAFAPRVVPDDLYRRIVNGSADDAVLTDLFGLESPYSQRVDELRAELTRLERLAIRGHAQSDDMARLADLTEELSPSPSSRARDILGEDE
jgi:energy-coupling factor transporter ATP-binding protein EcfA2